MIRKNFQADVSFMQKDNDGIEYQGDITLANGNPSNEPPAVLPVNGTDIREKIVTYKAIQREVNFRILCGNKKYEDHPLVRTLKKLERVFSRSDISDYFCGRKEDPKFATFPAQIEKAIEQVSKEIFGQYSQVKSVEELSQFIKSMCGPYRTGLLADMAKRSNPSLNI